MDATEINEKLVSSFSAITSSSREEAISFLENHEWVLDDAVSAFLAARFRSSNPQFNIPVSKRASDYPCESQKIKRRQRIGNISCGAVSVSVETEEYHGGVEKRIVPTESQVITNAVTLWRNGFTVDDGPLKTKDDQEDAVFIKESINPMTPFQDVGRSVDESDSTESMSLVIDPAAATTTSIKVRLADGTRIVHRFNTQHTVRDVRGFIDASRPDDSKDYQLLIMDFPPKPLPDFDQTIDQAGIANAVVIQKF